MEFAIGGVAVIALVVGIVEAAKRFGLKGKACEAVALGLGVVFVALAYGMVEGLIPAVATPFITWAVVAIFGGLAIGFAATGHYDLLKRLLGPFEYVEIDEDAKADAEE
jgi:hypothetical protein